ncbi:MAG: four helix bundle protein [Saprospiraceae bacterium]
MNKQELMDRTKNFAIAIILLLKKYPNNTEFKIIQNQIIRSSTSVGANYRAACRAKSSPDFINKLKIVEEELDETIYWLEILQRLSPQNFQEQLIKAKMEGNQLLAIFVKSIKTLRLRKS